MAIFFPAAIGPGGRFTLHVSLVVAWGLLACGLSPAAAQEPAATPAPAPQADSQVVVPAETVQPAPLPPLPPEKGWLRVLKDGDVWVDMKQKQVIVGGRICLREGMLEMFACPRSTKEHESIVSANTRDVRFVHSALLVLGAEPGPPVRFEPTYKPAEGTEIEVEVAWRDKEGTPHRVRAQEWVKHVKTDEPLKYPWVFAGSGFWTDEEGKERFYYAEQGEFICVSNFSTAMLDLPVESSAANNTLLFCAFTERIPPLGTPVHLILTPKVPQADAQESAEKEVDTAPAPTPKDNAKEPATEPVKQPATEPVKEPATEPAKEPVKEPAKDAG